MNNNDITKNVSGITSTIDTGELDTKDMDFYPTKGGFTGLRYKGKDYGRIVLRRALPVKHPMEYIFISDRENKEIGMIRDIRNLDRKNTELALEELDKRYYCPTVISVISAMDKLGYVYFEFMLRTKTGESKKGCAVKDVSRNIRMSGTDALLVFDTDGNRYKIDSLSSLDRKSLKLLQPYIF